jgi:hypothetical protein
MPSTAAAMAAMAARYGYGGYAQAQAPADLSFRCDVDYRGHVRNISIGRNY